LGRRNQHERAESRLESELVFTVKTDPAESVSETRVAPAWQRLVPVVLPAGIVLVLGFLGLGKVELWRDELATWSAASRSIGQLAAMAPNIDAFYFPYYLFMHFWTAVFGDSAVAMRVPSVLAAAAAAAAVVGLVAGRLFGRFAGLCAGTLFALIPMVTRMAQEARPYAFVVLFAALSTWLLLRAVDEPRWGRWTLYGLGMTLLGASQLSALALVAGHLVVVLVHGRRNFWRFAVAFAVAMLPLVPLAVLSLSEPEMVVHMLPAPDLLALFGVSHPFPPGSAVWPQMFRSTAAAWIIVPLALLAVVTGRRNRRDAWLAVGMFAAPIVAVWLVSQGPISVYWARYLLFVLPSLAVAAGLRLAALRWPVVSVAALLAFAAVTIPDQAAVRSPDAHDAAFYPYTMFSERPGQYASYERLAGVISAGYRPGDAIVYSNRQGIWFADTGIDYYLRGDRPRDVLLDRSAVQADNLWAVEHTDYATRLAGVRRVWVVGVGERRDPLAGSPLLFVQPAAPAEAAALRSGFTVSTVTTVPGFTVALMTAR